MITALLVLALGISAVAKLVIPILTIIREERAAGGDEEVTGIQCQGCLLDIRECHCPLSVGR